MSAVSNQTNISSITLKTKKKFGFTLVELIVVITILAILGTIAFLSLGGYSSSARDSARIENLSNLHKGLSVFRVKSNTFPLPESAVNISASGVVIGYQGYAKDQIAGIAGVSKGATVDPLDSNMYITYSVNLPKDKMQVMTYLENGGSLTAYNPSFVNQASAVSSTDYSKRIPFVKGDTLGIFVGSGTLTLNQPIQETGTGVDIVTSSTGYIVYLGKDQTIAGTGAALIPVLSNFDNTIGIYPGCDTKDIKLPNGQVWSACNVGATTASTAYVPSANDSTIGTEATNGKYFQWGESKAWDYDGGTGSSDACIWNRDTQSCGNGFGLGWSVSVFDTASGGIDRWNGGSTAIWVGSNRGPCALGYHVPTQTEWSSAYIAFGSTRNAFVRTLKIPMAGWRGNTDGLIGQRGQAGSYWYSSPNASNGASVYFDFSVMVPADAHPRAYGFPIRCLEN